MKTPVLFLIYNRPEYTKKVFEAIRKVKPERLFVSADGPKIGKLDDIELCERTRKVIEHIDWTCDVKTFFRNENLGCKLSMSGGINWFFENTDRGIILEDDCLPNESFFNYCQVLLEKYRDENRVMMISGSNPATSVMLTYDYFFSHFYHIWGWATWKRAWNKFDIGISDWPKFKNNNLLGRKISHNQDYRLFLEKMFDQVYNKKSSVWSVQWTYTCLVSNGFAILPKHNLISNIGFIGTHQMNNDQLMLDTKEINFKSFSGPKRIEVDNYIEDYLFKKSGLKALI